MRHIDLNIDNQTLVEECRNGDRDAMSILYTRFAPRMLHVISRYVNDRDSAQDILHDGFIAAFTRLDTIRNPERLDLWLATIMKNLSLKYLLAQSVTSVLEEIPESVEEPEVYDLLDFDILESLIRQLPEGYQKVFRLAVLEGKTHNEISEILGIAPKSSSSQLFHAKMRMRKLISDYKLRVGLISLLILIASTGMLFRSMHIGNPHDQDSLSAEALPQKHISEHAGSTEPAEETLPENTSDPVVSAKSSYTSAFSPTNSKDSNAGEKASYASVTAHEIQSSTVSDSVGESISITRQEALHVQPKEDDSCNDYSTLFAELPRKSSSDKGWSAGISFDQGIISFNRMNEGVFDANPPVNDPGPAQGTDDDKVPAQARAPHIPMDVESSLGSAPRRHHLPISLALTAEKHMSSWLGLETGIGYSYLHTDLERYKEPSTCHWHYLEIPLKVNLYAYTSPRMKLYLGLGGRVSIPVYSYVHIAPNPYSRSGRFDSKPVWSVAGSVGAAFRLSKRIDIFIEPSLRYHFPQECTIPNIWTDDEPWSISLPIGVRFSW